MKLTTDKLDNIQDAVYQATWTAITKELDIPFTFWPGDKKVEYFCDCLRVFIVETQDAFDNLSDER